MVAEPGKPRPLGRVAVRDLNVPRQRGRARELRLRVNGRVHAPRVVRREEEDVHAIDVPHALDDLLDRLVHARPHGLDLRQALGRSAHLVEDVPAVRRGIDPPVRKDVEGDGQVAHLAVEGAHHVLLDVDLAEDLVGLGVAHDGPVAADGVAHARVLSELARQAGDVASRAGHELDAALVGHVQDAAVLGRDGLVGREERVVHVNKDQLDHVLLPSRRDRLILAHDARPNSPRTLQGVQRQPLWQLFRGLCGHFCCCHLRREARESASWPFVICCSGPFPFFGRAPHKPQQNCHSTPAQMPQATEGARASERGIGRAGSNALARPTPPSPATKNPAQCALPAAHWAGFVSKRTRYASSARRNEISSAHSTSSLAARRTARRTPTCSRPHGAWPPRSGQAAPR